PQLRGDFGPPMGTARSGQDYLIDVVAPAALLRGRAPGPVEAPLRGCAVSTALIIFAKAPIPGEVKAALCPPLDHGEAASLHGTLVLDAVERAKGLPGASLYVAGAPDLAHPFFKVMEGRYGAKLLAQRGPDLGSRMRWAMQDAFEQGAQELLLTGTDLPTLPRAHLMEALTLIKRHDVVLGPTTDSGLHLIGLRKIVPVLFEGIAWRTASVLAETKKKLEQA